MENSLEPRFRQRRVTESMMINKCLWGKTEGTNGRKKHKHQDFWWYMPGWRVGHRAWRSEMSKDQEDGLESHKRDGLKSPCVGLSSVVGPLT